MRKQPPLDLPAPQSGYQIHANASQQQRQYKLITPLFGGGAIQQQCDEVTTIRGAEIRGQLRFWWRATHSSQFDTIAKMKQSEDKIWGKANKKKEQGPKHENTVQIEIDAPQNPKQIAPFLIIKREGQEPKSGSNEQSGIPSYAAFPLQPTRDELKQEKVSDPKEISEAGIVFTLKITFPKEYKDDIETALWAWEIFGGIGARTRRGFGALRLLDIDGCLPSDDHIPPSPELAKQWLKQKLRPFTDKDPGFPYISKNLRFQVVKDKTAPMSVWKSLIEKLTAFRQGSDARLVRTSTTYGRTRTTYGRSYWPEAETVRALTGQRRSDLPALGHPQKFPRAAFGLPILFHFIRNDQHNKNNPDVPHPQKDPEDATLQANIKGSDRLASPLILKPLLCQDKRACGIAVILDGYQIPPLVLKNKRGISHSVEHQLAEEDLQKLPHIKKLNHQTDILVAFLDYLEETPNNER